MNSLFQFEINYLKIWNSMTIFPTEIFSVDLIVVQFWNSEQHQLIKRIRLIGGCIKISKIKMKNWTEAKNVQTQNHTKLCCFVWYAFLVSIIFNYIYSHCNWFSTLNQIEKKETKEGQTSEKKLKTNYLSFFVLVCVSEK